jgi:hypothetical protein
MLRQSEGGGDRMTASSTLNKPSITFNGTLIGALLGTILLAIVVWAGVKSEQKFESAQQTYPWLSWVADQRSVLDRLRYPLAGQDEIATALSPKVINIISKIPLTLLDGATESDARQIVQTANDVTGACSMVEFAMKACAPVESNARFRQIELQLISSGVAKDWWLVRDGDYFTLKKLIQILVQTCNFAPYETESAFLVESVKKGDKSGIKSWIKFSAGQCQDVDLGKYRESPKVFAHSRAIESDTTAFLRQNSDYQNIWNDKTAAWGGDRQACTLLSSNPSVIQSVTCSQSGERKGFQPVIITTQGDVGIGRWKLADRGLCAYGCALGAPIASQSRWAQQLSSLLSARQEYERRFQGATPYDNGITVTDDNGPYRLGVRVSAVRTGGKTPFGSDIPFQIDDIVTEIDGKPVFGAVDLQIALVRFVEEKSVKETYDYQFWRRDAASGKFMKAEQAATVFFNNKYWISQGYGNSRLEAMWVGFKETFTFGFRCGSDIKCTNNKYLLKQLRPNAYWAGTIFVPPLPVILGLIGIPRLVFGTFGYFAIEILESSLQAIGNRDPGENIDSVISNISVGVASNVTSDFANTLIQQ